MEGEHRFPSSPLDQASVLRGVFQQREQCKAEVPRTSSRCYSLWPRPHSRAVYSCGVYIFGPRCLLNERGQSACVTPTVPGTPGGGKGECLPERATRRVFRGQGEPGGWGGGGD